MVVPSTAQMQTNHEKVALCPIDGPIGRRHEPRPVAVGMTREMSARLAAELRTAHDRGWAKYFEHACSQRDDEQFLRTLGDSLAVLVRHGPVADLTVPTSDLEQLLVDIVATWRPSKT
jgi:hypothetical protein